MLCKTTKKPVFLTKNGEGDLVVMDIETFSRRESMLRLREQLVAAEEDRLAGKKGFSIEEVDEMMKYTSKKRLSPRCCRAYGVFRIRLFIFIYKRRSERPRAFSPAGIAFCTGSYYFFAAANDRNY
jgi:hypothetical protein